MRWYEQDEVNQEDSEQNEVDGMKKGADSTGKVMHLWKRWVLSLEWKVDAVIGDESEGGVQSLTISNLQSPFTASQLCYASNTYRRVCLSVCLSHINKDRTTVMRFSPLRIMFCFKSSMFVLPFFNKRMYVLDSTNTLVFGDVTMLWKFEGYHPSETIFYKYPHSRLCKNAYFWCCSSTTAASYY